MVYSVEREIGGRNLVIETGKLAAQANGAVTVRRGDTVIMATVCVAPQARADIDFLPLTVDYEERLYAAGKIPGSFFRREGRPGQEAVLFGRLIDRPLRPLFPKGFYREVQIVITVLSADKENPPEVLGIVGASAALAISDIPFPGAIGASRITHLQGDYLANPIYSEIDQGDLSVVVAGTKDAVMMVEAESQEVSEETVLEAIGRAQDTNRQVIEMIEEMVAAVGKPKESFTAPDTSHEELDREINTVLNGRITQVLDAQQGRDERERALKGLEQEVQQRLVEKFEKDKVAAAFEAHVNTQMRDRILERHIRPDGRGLTEIRPITCEVGVLPRSHGSGLFTRGETQVLTIATLASVGMRQTIDSLSPEDTKRFIHHYNFPGFSVGEVKRINTGRREIGHGALAERSILSVVPDEVEFPYTIRLVSEVLSSNGSTSMASVCGSTLALMDAGVPVKSPVAGVAMGLVIGENGKYSILTDIAGMEDHIGDMDFKVAGTAKGINALQMDIKVGGLTHEILEEALKQAKEGRLFILGRMVEAISEPRDHLSPYAPKLVRITIPVAKIGAVIGPGGRMIRSIQEETGASIDIEDDGTVLIGSSDDATIQAAKSRIEALTRDLAVGDIFTGKVQRVTSFGAFVELVPGKDGLLRMEELGEVEEPLEVGQEITVMVKEVDHMGRINLSRRALYGDSESQPGDTSQPSRPPYQRAPGAGGPPPAGRGFGQRSDRPPPGPGNFRSGPGRRPPPRPPTRG